MTLLDRTFGELRPRFLTRSYLIAASFMGLIIWIFFQSHTPIASAVPMLTVYAVSTLLFPFAKLVWNEVRDFLVCDTFFIANAFVVLFTKFVVNLFLWSFAILIAPIGIGYLWFRSRAA